MEKKLLWILLVALVGIDVFMIWERNQLSSRLRDIQRDCTGARLKADYGEEQEAILNRLKIVPEGVRDVLPVDGREEAVQFVLLASVDDCTNCIEDEIFKLNQVMEDSATMTVEGFFVDEDRATQARRFIDNLAPAPRFSMEVHNLLDLLPGATTPLVLVVRAHDGKILDVHKPIPEDLSRRDAFYARWTSLLGLT